MEEFVREIKEIEADRILREAEVSDDNQEGEHETKVPEM